MPKTTIDVPSKEELDSELSEIEKKSRKRKEKKERKPRSSSKPADGRMVAPILLLATLLIGYLLIVLS